MSTAKPDRPARQLKRMSRRVVRALGRRSSVPSAAGPNVKPPPLNRANAERLMYFARFFDRIDEVPGDVVECGVGHGDSLVMLSILAKHEGKGRRVWGFDSFEGFPEPTVEDDSPRNPQRGQWRTELPDVVSKLRASGFDEQFVNRQATLVPGFFETSLELFRGDSIALLHLDCDLYGSYRTCLAALYPLVSPGGVVAFDEYVNTGQLRAFPGAQRAIDEYFGDDRRLLHSDRYTGQYFLVKPDAGSQPHAE